jgi:hypothetical protein
MRKNKGCLVWGLDEFPSTYTTEVVLLTLVTKFGEGENLSILKESFSAAASLLILFWKKQFHKKMWHLFPVSTSS